MSLETQKSSGFYLREFGHQHVQKGMILPRALSLLLQDTPWGCSLEVQQVKDLALSLLG